VTPVLNEEQRAAVEARGLVFVSAGAGSGKTSVLVERFAHAVLVRGVSPERILAITYTERAASELSARIRARLLAEERPELARALDGAWISTIHGFCSRLLRRFALAAGVDPGFTVLDAPAADELRRSAYDAALSELHAVHGDALLDLITAYEGDTLRRVIDAAHERLRTAGLVVGFPDAAPHDLDAAKARLEREAREVVAALDGGHAGRWGAENAERAGAVLAVLGAEPSPGTLVKLEEYAPQGKEERTEPYAAAVGAVEEAAREAVYAAHRPLLQAVLTTFAERYRAAKAAEAALDFDDLQLETVALLGRRAEVRTAVQGLYSEVMVDEFQDTNELQCAIVDAVTDPHADRFFVGDEHQSIYRFRNADVDVFRRRRRGAEEDAAASSLALRRNYRSRPELLAVVNHLFGRGFGPSYLPLEAAARPGDEPAPLPAVEVLVTDRDAARAAEVEPRESEARHLAGRLHALVTSGACRPGEIVLLFAAGTDSGLYERALDEAGLDTVSATGRSYFVGQQVRDLLAYLALLRNRYDDFALLGVLASPLVGVSNDGLLHLRHAAGRRPLFRALEGPIPETLDADDARLVAAFRQRFDRLVAAAPRLSLAATIERVVAAHDYDLALLRRRDGARRFANVRKLVRLAREHEGRHGRSLEGFLVSIAERGVGGGREAEAAVAEEESDAVRLMTVHAAKGLEFPVVVLADAGRGAAGGAEPLAIGPDGSLRVKVPAATGGLVPTAGYRDAIAAERLADEEERRRVTYVGVTRAVRHLIISGVVTDEAIARRSTPMGWLLDLLDVPFRTAVDIAVPGGRVALRPDPVAVAAPQPEIEVAGQLAFFDDPAEVGPARLHTPVDLPALAPLPVPPPLAPERLSFSALALYGRCPYRFHAEHVLGLRAVERAGTPPAPPSVSEGEPSPVALSPLEVGTAVHEVLEFDAAGDPRDRERRVLARFPHALPGDLDRVGQLTDAWVASPLAARVAGATVRREARFVTDAGGVTLTGQIDLLARNGGRVHVVDYKTNRLGDRTAAEIRDDGYGLQEAVYALAALGAGAEEVEVSFAFLDGGDAEASRRFGPADAPELGRRVMEAVAGARSGPYPPRPGEDVCRDCPALDLVCAGPRLDLDRVPADA
jgi:ATP-dependent exoDNAse (exonuclease V) beta subunit